MRINDWRRLPLLILAVAVFAIAGCGDDSSGESNAPAAETSDSGDATTAGTATPPKDSPAAFASQLSELVAAAKTKRDCKALNAINRRSVYGFACPSSAEVRESLARFEVVDAARYGTGGVVDYKSGRSPDGATMLTFLAPNGKWATNRFGILTDPTVGTSDEDDRSGYEKAALGYLKAVQERDCDAYNNYALGSTDDDKVVCKEDFPRTQGLARLIEGNPGAKPEYLGGNGTFGFLRLKTASPTPRAFTISVLDTPPGSVNPYVVMDAVAAPVE